MSKIVKAKQPCPFDGCSSSDAFHEFEDGSTWCFSCSRGTWDRPKPEDLTKVFNSYRGVSKESNETAGFYSYVDDDGQVHYREYPIGEQSKFRDCLHKRFWTTGKLPTLGGTQLWNAGSSKTICIVEGEEDFVSFMDMCNLPVVYLTSASIGSNRKELFEYLNPFSKIVMAFESDEAGENAQKIIGTMFPGKVYKASLTKHKDANEYLTHGDGNDFKWAVINARLFTPDYVYNSMEDFSRILSDVETSFYVPTPWESLNEKVRGLPLGKIVLITGQEGLGKTEILRAMEYHTLKEAPEHPIAVIHHEESKKEVLDGLCSYILEKNCKDPDNPVPVEDKLAALELITKSGNLNILDIDDVADTVASIMDRFAYMVKVCGVKYFFVDPINQFVPPDDGEGNSTKFLDSLAQSMGKFVIDHNVCCVWTAHVNDEGATRNSRMIGKSAAIRIDISRDQMHEDDTERNTTKLYVPKNRPYSKTGAAGAILFQPETFTLTETTVNELPF